MSVDLPDPFGPSKPMQCPESAPFSRLRMVRCPSFTSRLSSSITAGILPLSCCIDPYCCYMSAAITFCDLHQRRKSQGIQIHPKEAAVARDLYGTVVAVSADHAWLGF